MQTINITGRLDGAAHENTCWVAKAGSFDLAEDRASMMLFGYKDGQAFLDGKSHADSVNVHFKLSELATFEAVWTEIATKLVSPGGPFEGGAIVDVAPESSSSSSSS